MSVRARAQSKLGPAAASCKSAMKIILGSSLLMDSVYFGLAMPGKDQLSGPLPERVEQDREGRRLLAAARIIEMIAREGRAPVLEQARQASGLDVRPGVILG